MALLLLTAAMSSLPLLKDVAFLLCHPSCHHHNLLRLLLGSWVCVCALLPWQMVSSRWGRVWLPHVPCNIPHMSVIEKPPRQQATFAEFS
jgi:hypothetical protein